MMEKRIRFNSPMECFLRSRFRLPKNAWVVKTCAWVLCVCVSVSVWVRVCVCVFVCR